MTKKKSRTEPSSMDLVPIGKVPRSIRTGLQEIAARQDKPMARVLRAALTSYIATQKAGAQ